MLVKCETKSNRVKGLSFHPKLSWVLASLHNGTIQLWDYRFGSLIDTFEDHESGPVRGVCFHLSQPLFVSGGDDYKIKVWNYKHRRCLFTLLGHLDYIRSVEFHDEYPWILTASDDQTVRIWNWQSRASIAVLTGHNHYVMCAHFHHKEDLVVSASLDQTIRVWDTSGLREKSVSIPGGGSGGMGSSMPGLSAGSDVFGATDAVVKYVLEGHERGVNWAAFHPSLPLIVSGADDRLIKLWRMNDSKAWEVDTLRGHFNNVSCVVFHSKKELILSNSEDRTIRVWDVTKRTGIHTFRRENDRFWVITTHRFSNLIAVGHDAGMVVFKLDRERPLIGNSANKLYMVKDGNLVALDAEKGSEGNAIAHCRRAPNAMTSGMKSMWLNTLNPTETNVLVFYNQDGGAYDLFTGSNDCIGRGEMNLSAKQGAALAVAFTARNRFAVLQPNGGIGIYNLENELSKKFDPPAPTDNIYPGGNNRLLLKSEDRVLMYDLTARKVVDEVSVQGQLRYVQWSQNQGFVALISKHNVLMVGKNLEHLHSFHENIRIKSGAWDENGVFVYSTLSHVKYCLPNGDSGIIHSLQNPIYIFRVAKQFIYFLDREQQMNRQRLNCTEYMFKLALAKRNFNDMKMWIKNGRLCGNVVIGYLKKKGFPEVALHFVEDQQTRFNLALEYGHIEEAMTAAQNLDDRSCWTRLGQEALRQGNQQIVEMVHQKTKNFDALSFLYLITGNVFKLKKMLKIAEMRNDTMSRFNNALMLGAVEERVKIMAEMGQVPLAALTAKAHNLAEFMEKLDEQVQCGDIAAHVPPNASLLIPPIPLVRPTDGASVNWPLIVSAKAIFEQSNFEALPQDTGMLTEDTSFMDADEGPEEDKALGAGGGWADDDDLGDLAGGGGGWGDDMDLGMDADLAAVPDVVPEKQDGASLSSLGDSAATKWLRKRKLPVDLAAAGEFEEALQLLHRRIGLVNAAPLEGHFKDVYWATCTSLSGLPQCPSQTWPLLKHGSMRDKDVQPLNLYSVQYILEQLKESHKLTTQGKFQESLDSFRATLQLLPLAVAETSEEEQQLTEAIEICRAYTTAMRLECTRKTLPAEEVARNIELAAYLTCCNLQPGHLVLTLRVAMSTAFKAQNFVTAATFAKRLLQGGGASVKPDVAAQARKLLQVCEQKSGDAHQIRFDPKASPSEFTMCAATMVPIQAGAPTVRCPYCSAVYSADKKGRLCDICQLAEIGANVLGVQFRPL